MLKFGSQLQPVFDLQGGGDGLTSTDWGQPLTGAQKLWFGGSALVIYGSIPYGYTRFRSNKSFKSSRQQGLQRSPDPLAGRKGAEGGHCPNPKNIPLLSALWALVFHPLDQNNTIFFGQIEHWQHLLHVLLVSSEHPHGIAPKVWTPCGIDRPISEQQAPPWDRSQTLIVRERCLIGHLRALSQDQNYEVY